MSPELTGAIAAAKKGAEKALQYFGHNPKVILKPDHTPVTQADKETEAIIKETILLFDKNTHFVGEESGGAFTYDSTWIIDPIDGTKNFIRGLPFWSILIAKCIKGEIVLGVSYTPQLHELVYAQKGQGAFRNGESIHVSSIKDIADAYISYPGDPSLFPKKDNVITLLNTCMSCRGFGDAYSYQLVAQGKIDSNIEPGFSVWDVAPFKVIIEEAGGKVTTFSGQPWTIKDNTMVASNGLLHDKVIEFLQLNQ